MRFESLNSDATLLHDKTVYILYIFYFYFFVEFKGNRSILKHCRSLRNKRLLGCVCYRTPFLGWRQKFVNRKDIWVYFLWSIILILTKYKSNDPELLKYRKWPIRANICCGSCLDNTYDMTVVKFPKLLIGACIFICTRWTCWIWRRSRRWGVPCLRPSLLFPLSQLPF